MNYNIRKHNIINLVKERILSVGPLQRLEAAEMKFLRHLFGITKPDKENNQSIREKTGAENIVKEIKQYQERWLQHIQRMDKNRIPKQALQYKPKDEGT